LVEKKKAKNLNIEGFERFGNEEEPMGKLLLVRNQILLCIVLLLIFLPCIAFSYTFTSIDYPGADRTIAYGINDNNQIVGYYANGTGYYGFLKDGENFNSFSYPGSATYAHAINNNGQIVGFYVNATSGTHGFLKDGANFYSLDYPSASETYAYGINDNGQIVGSYKDSTGYHGENFSSFNYSGLPTYAYDINDSGQIVGYYVMGGGTGQIGKPYGFLKDGVYMGVNSLLLTK
jgi:probable HAF family extracellular repeat protein